ncbi:MAG TPA: thiamine phosphate synthase, partial [Rhodoblastus sp.]|nr:thiamine phosphate synthase [Rhodoblastus sp.]
MKLDPFYLIVDHVDWLRRLLPCGVKLVQLRIKQSDEADLRAQIGAARDLCQEFGAQLIVNDYWRLALELGCDFVHLGQEDLAGADLAAIRAGGIKL